MAGPLAQVRHQESYHTSGWGGLSHTDGSFHYCLFHEERSGWQQVSYLIEGGSAATAGQEDIYES